MSGSSRTTAVVDHLHQVGLSPKTIQNYTGHLVRAERWCEQHGTTLLEVTGDQLHTFVVEQGPSHGNRRAMRCALEHYWRVCGRISPPVYAITIPSRPRPGRRALDPTEAMRVATAALERGDRRGLAVLLALLGGLNGFQIARLRWDSLLPGGLMAVGDNAGRTSTVLIHEAVSAVLSRLRRRSEWVFPSRGVAGHVGVDTVYDWVNEVSIAADVEGVTTDCLRRSRVSDDGALVKLARRGGRRGGSRPGDDRLDDFRVSLRRAGLSERSVACYSSTVARVDRWCAQRSINLVEISADDLSAFVALLPQTHATLRIFRKALQHYFKFHQRSDPPLWVIRSLPRPRMVCRTLEPDEAKALIKTAEARGGAPGLAVALGLYQALRRAEIAELRWDCFDDGWLTVTGKGGVTATLPVHPVVTELLKSHKRSGPWLFPGRFGGPVTPATIWDWIRKLSDEAGVTGMTPHRLRHTALATANDATGDLRSVQAFARHADPRTTAGYTRATKERLLSVVNSINFERS